MPSLFWRPGFVVVFVFVFFVFFVFVFGGAESFKTCWQIGIKISVKKRRHDESRM